VYRTMIKMTYEDMNRLGQKHSALQHWERDSILHSLGEVETGEWYEGRFFKKLGDPNKRRK